MALKSDHKKRNTFQRLSIRIGQIIHGANGPHVLVGDDEGREAVGEVVEPTSYGRLLRRYPTPAEALVVSLAPFERSVDEDVESPRFHR